MPRVMVVDDNYAVLRFSSVWLRRAGFDVDVAASLLEARRITGPPDVMVLDRRLPNGDGKELMALYPGVPTVVISGGHEDCDLHKPFTEEELIGMIHLKMGARP